MLKNKKILVTGGAGSIGSNIVKILSNRGAQTTVVDNLSAYPFEYEKEFGVKELKNVDLIKLDIAKNKKQINTLIQKMDVVVHAAAFADVAASVRNPHKDFTANIVATQNMLESCKKSNVEKFLFVSSAATYGNSKKHVFREDYPCFPLSTYGLSKYWGEQQTRLYHELYGLDTTSVRLFSIYGSPQVPKMHSHSWVVAIFSMLAKKGKPITIYGKGNQIRDFIHVTDVAEAIVLSLEKSSATGKFFNIGTGTPTKIKEIPEKIFKHFESVPVTFKPLPKGDPQGGYADTTLMKKLLNWKPKFNLDEGIRQYVKWLKNNEHLIPDWL